MSSRRKWIALLLALGLLLPTAKVIAGRVAGGFQSLDVTDNIVGHDTVTAPKVGSSSYTDNGYFNYLVAKNVFDNQVVNVKNPLYGAVGDNTTDDTAAIQEAATASAGGILFIPEPSVEYKVTGTITIASNTTIVGAGRPLIRTTSTTLPIFQGQAVSNVTITGLRLHGGGSGGAAGDVGLIDINSAVTTLSSNIRIYENEIYDFRNGITATYCQNLWIERNVVHNFYLYGILASKSYNMNIDRNKVYTIDSPSARNAYGIMATGDNAGGKTTQRNSISFNHIASIQSWDGIMTHDVSGLHIIGNDIRDVRTGIDVGHFDNTNIVRDVFIIGNYIESTTTDAWVTAAALHAGISCIGANATYRVQNLTIIGNTIRNFFTTSGLVPSGDFSNITVSFADQAVVSGNIVVGAGSINSNAGIYVVGNSNNPTITGNILQGTMAAGGIRFAGVVATSGAISGNTISQDNTTDIAVYITGSTLSGFTFGENATNADAGYEFSVATSTVALKGFFRSGSATFNPVSLDNSIGESTDVTCTGAAPGDYAEASFSLDLQGITMTAAVKSANIVTVRFQNGTGGTINLASGTLRVRTRPYGY